MSSDRVTPRQLMDALDRVGAARAEAQRLCRAFAQQETGWEKGDRIKQLRQPGEVVEIVHFAGVHPHKWYTTPIASGFVVRKNGTMGKRAKYITIDPEGSWKLQWKKLEGGR